MHLAAREFVNQFSTKSPITVVEIGSRYINGTIKDLFPNARWTGIDLYPGRLVDWVGSAMDFTPEEPVDMVICCEVLEHAKEWRGIIARASTWLKTGGSLLMTCAGPGRKPHSAIDGKRLRIDEYYKNLSVEDISESLIGTDMRLFICRAQENDTQLFAVKNGAKNGE